MILVVLGIIGTLGNIIQMLGAKDIQDRKAALNRKLLFSILLVNLGDIG